ncbi:hypothetical protein PINS_up005331 [Pythium insidiosum]|nr:hypothetical protein PINS_up005331 [Pythium insidiosum]
MSSNGTILRNEVVGQVVMKTLLTGMPECKLGLNDKLTMQKGADAPPAKVAGQKRGTREVEVRARYRSVGRKMVDGISCRLSQIDDCTFHRCVRLGKFDADRTITFIPPDGEFELMKYRVTENINLPFKIMPAYQEQGATRLSVTLKIAALFSPRLFATNLVIKIPVRTAESSLACRPLPSCIDGGLRRCFVCRHRLTRRVHASTFRSDGTCFVNIKDARKRLTVGSV